MNTSDQELAAISAGEENSKFRKMFPVTAFLIRHPIELLALAITLIGIVCFAAGSSFYAGWTKAAGISSNLFPVGTYETMLAGITLTSPWIYSGSVFAFIVVYVHLLEIYSEWSYARRGRESNWQFRRRAMIVTAARRERLSSGLETRDEGKAHQVWAALEFRNRWAERKRSLDPKAKRFRRVTARAGVLIVALCAMAMTCILYLALKAFIIDMAHLRGEEKYVGLYLAVTGKVPAQFETKFSATRLQELACSGEEDRWAYRSIDLLGDAKHQAYVIQSTDKFFLLLDKDGSSLHSFGDAAFSLRENAIRPVSTLARKCKQLPKT